MDIRQIRDRLNELTFENGRRETSIGRASEMFPGQDADGIASQLQQLEVELHRHDLDLARSEKDPDELLVVQNLKYRKDDLAWLAEGIQWAARITTVAGVMVLPAVIGMWLDGQLGTSFLALLGLSLGVPLGLWYLILMTKTKAEARDNEHDGF